MPSLPTGTVIFPFTDIEGSTALLQRLGDCRYAEILEEHRQLLRTAFAEKHGQETDAQGEAFLVAFPRARDAVAAAVTPGANSRYRMEALFLCTGSTRTPTDQDERS